ncbi:Deoxyribose-phosphate aldolase [Zancudomyces culisetae]|uniref:deoxyribose-phosphate aldolase n=1 Tax=Zancudomyces culisetae TaxID=1213189 RepID=A0A1R1PNT6_ZANCU|nr:Deoxyribose-phosphate aldolase [Zancudomyces culisetae]|eukprot:OMH82542.1 Deoxyribose-phosphate aldolase [Zancudomyces culisetae]
MYTVANLTPIAVARTIDHALLRPDMTTDEVVEGCKLCMKYHAFSVCVRPCDVKLAADVLKGSDVAVCTVISFPHGTSSTAGKVAESLQALEDGAVELDMVINIGYLKSGKYDQVEDDIRQVVSAAKKKNPSVLVKVIFECCLLTSEEIRKACELSSSAGADFVKTSTGFSTGGAKIPDLKLMRESCPESVQVKASGGIRNLDYLIECLNVGCTRIGCSGTKPIVEELIARQANPAHKVEPTAQSSAGDY